MRLAAIDDRLEALMAQVVECVDGIKDLKKSSPVPVVNMEEVPQRRGVKLPSRRLLAAQALAFAETAANSGRSDGRALVRSPRGWSKDLQTHTDLPPAVSKIPRAGSFKSAASASLDFSPTLHSGTMGPTTTMAPHVPERPQGRVPTPLHPGRQLSDGSSRRPDLTVAGIFAQKCGKGNPHHAHAHAAHRHDWQLHPEQTKGFKATAIDLKDRAVKTLQRHRHQSKWMMDVHTFLEEPESGMLADIYSKFCTPLILFSVIVAILQTGTNPWVHGRTAGMINLALELFFLAECVLRFIVCPSRCFFLISPYNVIDVLSAAPVALRLNGGSGYVQHEVLEGIVPVVRIFKLMRRFQTFHLILNAVWDILGGLPVMLYTLSLIGLGFSAIIYLVEPRDNIDSLPTAMWMVLVTITTVGYGDYTPTTTIGTLVISCAVIVSVFYMAMPIGIIGHVFTKVWENREWVLLTYRMRARLEKYGYTAGDVEAVFQLFDRNNDGVMDVGEFCQMMQEMNIGLTEVRVMSLFQHLDEDGSGNIDCGELVAAIFPGSYYRWLLEKMARPEFSTVFSGFAPTKSVTNFGISKPVPNLQMHELVGHEADLSEPKSPALVSHAEINGDRRDIPHVSPRRGPWQDQLLMPWQELQTMDHDCELDAKQHEDHNVARGTNGVAEVPSTS